MKGFKNNRLRCLFEGGLCPLGAAGRCGIPEHLIRMIVPSTSSGGTDLATRIVMPKLGELLGQQIVIANRGGASGNRGAQLGARAASDGYTLTAAIASVSPAMRR